MPQKLKTDHPKTQWQQFFNQIKNFGMHKFQSSPIHLSTWGCSNSLATATTHARTINFPSPENLTLLVFPEQDPPPLSPRFLYFPRKVDPEKGSNFLDIHNRFQNTLFLVSSRIIDFLSYDFNSIRCLPLSLPLLFLFSFSNSPSPTPRRLANDPVHLPHSVFVCVRVL